MATVAEKKNIKQTRILDAAYKLFCDKNVNSTAIDDVVRLAGVAKGTFYLYFKDKYDLLDQIVVKKTSIVIVNAYDKLKKVMDCKDMTLAEQMLFFTDYVIDYLKDNKKLVALVDKNMTACFKAFAEIRYPEFEHAVGEFIKMYVNRGYTEREAQMTLYLIVDMIGSVCCDAIITGEPYGIEEIRPEIHRMVEKMVS